MPYESRAGRIGSDEVETNRAEQQSYSETVAHRQTQSVRIIAVIIPPLIMALRTLISIQPLPPDYVPTSQTLQSPPPRQKPDTLHTQGLQELINQSHTPKSHNPPSSPSPRKASHHPNPTPRPESERSKAASPYSAGTQPSRRLSSRLERRRTRSEAGRRCWCRLLFRIGSSRGFRLPFGLFGIRM